MSIWLLWIWAAVLGLEHRGFMKFENKRLPVFGLMFMFFFSLQGLGQAGSSDTSGPLGDVAKKSNKSSASKAKIVVTDDNLKSQRGPIPEIALEGMDNSDEIVKAIQEFGKSHSPAETEDAVRAWYEEWDKALVRAIDDNKMLIARKEDRNLSGVTRQQCYEDPPDYCRELDRRNSEIRQDRDDYHSYNRNGLHIGRIQQTLIAVRGRLQAPYLRYSWFKVRNANGVGSF